MRSLPLLVAVLVSLTGCIKTATNDPTAFCIEQQKELCAFQFNCCDLDERAKVGLNFFNVARNEGECNDNAVNLCELLAKSQEISSERGRIVVDGEKAQSCLDEVRAAREDCDIGALRNLDDCDGVIKGVVEDGDTCTSSGECDDGICDIPTDSDGEPDDLDAELGIGEGECKAKGDVGDACEFDDCKDGLFCNSEDECARLPGKGDPCPDFACDDGLDCEFDDVSGEDVCVEADDTPDDDEDICKG